MSNAITIRDIKTILTQPAGSRLIVVKIITTEPDLYGVGCATFTQRFHAVHTTIEKHIKPFLIGRNISRIEDTWQMLMVNGYWRNGPVLNNAISGIDMALWDIQGKLAGMPVYQILGGKCREGAAVYVHADGRDPGEVTANVEKFLAEGYRYIRIQMGGYGGKTCDIIKPDGAPPGAYYDPREYIRRTIGMMEYVRASIGDEIELLHDVHERLKPSEAIKFAKDVEPFDLFFLEDLLSPEDLPWFGRVRHQSTVPLAMGELFNHPREWQPLISGRLIDFIRMHISQMGGITPARNVAAFANMYGIRTAWHGPGDVSPVGHAANLHLDLWAPNFGIQEWCRFPEVVYEIFPGTPEVRNGYMYANDRPGLGIDINEELASKFPCEDEVISWTQTRLPDGGPARP
jgi:mannonate dehydratase